MHAVLIKPYASQPSASQGRKCIEIDAVFIKMSIGIRKAAVSKPGKEMHVECIQFKKDFHWNPASDMNALSMEISIGIHMQPSPQQASEGNAFEINAILIRISIGIRKPAFSKPGQETHLK
jgi:hypothetical protein